MDYKVAVVLYERVEADSEEQAKQKFKDNFEFADLNYAEYNIEGIYDETS
jgi:hypothetical protein